MSSSAPGDRARRDAVASGTPTTSVEAAETVVRSERERTAALVAGLAREFEGFVAAAELVATDDEHDPEGHTIAFERQQVAALLRDARSHLADVDAAIARLAAGTYGRCERCGGPVGDERLVARPAARACVACAW
ncbi:MAG: TraR/DksA C4-type zinc finger protein [Acidimicrobiia bacterium]|jgi:RNA polymerase-binding transcription factor DksA|nr:TraR/DksA C4-type zinc finger protein [Acidimicrobiia bacterium]